MSKTKKKAPASIVWFNVPADDIQRAQKFYKILFGWKIKPFRGMKDFMEIDTGGADASLDDIAKQAGVGAGTLYRHFPTRDALIEAVYRSEVEKLAAAERKFTETMPPVHALRTWMLLFVDHIAAKQITHAALAQSGRLTYCRRQN